MYLPAEAAEEAISAFGDSAPLGANEARIRHPKGAGGHHGSGLQAVRPPSPATDVGLQGSSADGSATHATILAK